MPTLEYIEELCSALNLSVAELIGEANQNDKKVKKPLSKKSIVNLIICAIVFACATLITGFGLIIGYVIVPAACKTT